MKRIFLVFIVLFTASTIFGQRTLTSDEVWSGTHSETDNVIVPNGITLSIDPGTTVQFASGKSLKVTGTGRLFSGSLSGSSVTFTASNGISWGHLFCENTTASYLRNCIIEKGNASGINVAYGPNYGGGLYVKTSSLTVEKCTFRNNNAVWGGGIFIGSSVNPFITNSTINSNTATEGGGGLYIWQASNSVVSNCLIFSNHCSGTTYGGGGAFLGYSTGNAKLVNCLIANNSATNQGNGIYFLTSANAKIINSVIWGGSGNPIYFNNTSTSVMQYCGVQGGTYSTCINLNSSNTAINGPNFVLTDGSDWSITYISPLRDTGANTYPGVTIPSTDFVGHPQIHTKDIGAYEVQYSRWTGATSTSWSTSTNWEASVDPSTGSGDVIIPTGISNYPVDASNPDFTIGSGKQMIIAPGAKVTLDDLTNNGTLKLESDATTVSSLIATSFSGSDATIELNLNGGEENSGMHDYRWHYISTPVDEIVIADIFQPVTYHVLGWYDNRVTGTLLTGWAAFDGWLYYTVPPGYGGPTFTKLTPGKGYDYYASNDHEYTFPGQLNTGNYNMLLSFSTPPGSATLNGYNLLGNPYSAGLNWDEITFGTYASSYPTNTSKGINYTKNNDNIYYNNGISVPDGEATGIIPPMQGFFVKTYSTGNSITLPAGARTHSINPVRYKGTSEIPLVRLSTSENGLKDETVVRFDESAKSGLDYDFDAVKMIISSNTQIYSVSGGVNYAINGQPYPVDDKDTLKIPVTVNLLTTGSHTLSAKQQGLSDFNIQLKDKITGSVTDLKNVPDIVFSESAGLITDRFVLLVSYIVTGIEKPVVTKNIFNIYQAYDNINIQTLADEWDGKMGSIRVFDLAGKIVSNYDYTEFWKNSLTQVKSPGTKGLYIVEITSGFKRYVGKVVIR